MKAPWSYNKKERLVPEWMKAYVPHIHGAVDELEVVFLVNAAFDPAFEPKLFARVASVKAQIHLLERLHAARML